MPNTCASVINLTFPEGSVGSASNPEKFNTQDFEELKNDCARQGKLFVDTTFPPNKYSFGQIENLDFTQVKWCRPKELMEILGLTGEPVFGSCGQSRFDFGQGDVGNCWFLAAISSLTLNKKLIAQVVPEQSFDNYAGIFHFRFWRFGKWVDVVIDDHLPMFQGRFLSVHTKQTKNEFWVPLMEKAYAKVCGSYADMSGGYTSESCKDMTGGFSMNFLLQSAYDHDYNRDDEAELWSFMSAGSHCMSMICCGTPVVSSKRVMDSIRKKGLVDGHAYSVTKTAEVYHRGMKVKLVRVLNPWGQQEWNGDWSDNSPLWKEVRDEDRSKCTKDDNGEFWIELEDFCRNFEVLSICCENPNFLDGDLTCQWQLLIKEGSWTTAGGNVNDFPDTFYTNPQFRVQIKVKEEQEKEDMNCFVCLMQKPSARNRKQSQYFSIFPYVFKVPEGTKAGRLGRTFFGQNRPIGDIEFEEMRETTRWYSLPPGEYLIVPSTKEQYMMGDFVLAVYTKSLAKIDHYHGEDHGNDHDSDEGELTLPEVPTKKDEDDPKRIFDTYAGKGKQLDARQLQKLLNKHVTSGQGDGFSQGACIDFIITMNTDDKLRMMNFDEFLTFWKKINKYRQIFINTDTEYNGFLEKHELNKAIKAAGMHSTDEWVDKSMFRYSFGSSTVDLVGFLKLMIELDHKTSSP